MAGTTRKQLVNKVLSKLREDELTDAQTISSVPYANTVAGFINDIKEEVEDAWNWSQLRVDMTFSTTSGQNLYNLGDATLTSTALTVIDSDSNVITLTTIPGYNNDDASNERTQILSMWNLTQNAEMRPMSDNYFNRVNNVVDTPQNGPPIYYRSKGFDASGDMAVDLYPIPDGVYSVKSWCYVPQEALSNDADILVLSSAEKAIIYGAWAMCISERGEDGGQLYDEVTGKYKNYLDTAIARDRELNRSLDEGGEGDFIVV